MLVTNQLIGFGIAPLTTLTFVNSAASALNTIVIPSDAAPGDLAVLFDYAVGSAVGDVVPTNWTGITTVLNFDSTARFRVSYKILVGGDPGATVTGMDDDTEDKVMLVFRGNVPILSVTSSTWTGVIQDSNPGAQAISASGQATPLLVLGMVGIVGTAAFSTASPAFDATVANADTDIIAGYKIYNSAPADHSIDMNDLGSRNALAGGYLICA